MIPLCILGIILLCFIIEYGLVCKYCKKAAELYHEGIDEVIICSDAAVANNYTEADVMAQVLNKLGVAEEYISNYYTKEWYNLCQPL